MQLLTERLFLIPLRPDGMCALLARTTDPELVQPYTDMLDLSLAHPDQWVWYTAWGLYQNDSGDWVGDLCFKGLPENGHPEIGYGLLPEYEHQGYATEAAMACKAYAFGVLGLDVVYSIIRDNNFPSQRVAQRNGMVPVGRTVKHYYHMDMPHILYAVRAGDTAGETAKGS